MMSRKNRRATSLVEVVASLFVVSILLVMTSTLITGFFKASRQNTAQRTAYEANEVLERIASDIQDSTNIGSNGDVLDMTKSSLPVRYELQSGRLKRSVDGREQILLSDVSGLNFSQLPSGNWEIRISVQGATGILKTFQIEVFSWTR